MEDFNTNLIFFSPTGTTRKTIEEIYRGIGSGKRTVFDLTAPDWKSRLPDGDLDGLSIIGAPVYGGRIPPEACKRLRRVRGAASPVILVVLYGNREIEDALLELNNIVEENDFIPIAGGSFIGEHSFDSAATPIAPGRPDADDLEKARGFGKSIYKKIRDNDLFVNLHHDTVRKKIPRMELPGNFPYRAWDVPGGIAPAIDHTACTLCGSCSDVCPTAAIRINNKVVTDGNKCMLCSACVKACPVQARSWDNEWVINGSNWLSRNFSTRKEPVFYL